MKWMLIGFVVAMCALLWAPVLLAQDASIPIDPEALLASYAGIVTLTWLIVEFAGRWISFGPSPEKSLKPVAAALVAVALGVASKMFGIAFAAVKWPVFIVALAYYGVLGNVALNKVLKGLGIQIPNKAEVGG